MVAYLDEPCPKCNWRMPGFHVCIDKNDPANRKIVVEKKDRHKHTGEKDLLGREERRSRISDGMSRYWETVDAGNRKRDDKIVALYSKDELTIRQIADLVRINQRAVMRVLHRARDAGEIKMRGKHRRRSNTNL